MAIKEQEIKEYFKNSESLELVTVDESGEPDIRTLGGYGVSELNVYFATAKGSNKVNQLNSNNKVAILFQHENQEISSFINITIYGKAVLVKGQEFKTGKEIIAKRRPQITATEETHNIYRVDPKKIKVLNFSSSIPEERISYINL
jgi:uncharacterized pyridoxamine 5'-phosphate oxidase family protein